MLSRGVFSHTSYVGADDDTAPQQKTHILLLCDPMNVKHIRTWRIIEANRRLREKRSVLALAIVQGPRPAVVLSHIGWRTDDDNDNDGRQLISAALRCPARQHGIDCSQFKRCTQHTHTRPHATHATVVPASNSKEIKTTVLNVRPSPPTYAISHRRHRFAPVT